MTGPIVSKARVRDMVREGRRGLASRPGRTALLIAAIGAAVALVVITLGLSQTASAQVSSKFDLQRNREVTVRVPTRLDDTGTISGVPADVADRLRQIRGLTGSGVLEKHERIKAHVPGQPESPATLVGISDNLLPTIGATVEWAPGHAHHLGRQEALIGAYAAKDLLVGPVQLGPVIDLRTTRYAVVGVIRSAARAPEIAANIAVDWRAASQLSTVDASFVYLETVGGAAQQVARQAPLAIDAVHADAMEVQAPPDPSGLRDAIQSDVHTALVVLTAVAALASLLGVANAMMLGVLERVGEFGLRRAIGARPVHVVGQTSIEAIMTGLIGGLAGLYGGLGVVLAVTIAHRWQPVLDLRSIPVAVMAGIVVGILGGLPASLRAGRIEPADALRR